jgi:Rps23 Pro-64 3,4-dihydroxylase Tpa1-like proline 4-hydroxylase
MSSDLMPNDLASSVINAIDLPALRRQMAEAPAFPHFCIDGFLDEAFAREVHAAFPSYREALTLGRAFEAVNEKRKIQVTDASLFPPAIRRLHEALAAPEFVAQLAAASGIADLSADPALTGGGIHETDGGGRLDVHVDFNFNADTGLYRRLNLLVYFNPDWKTEYGGQLDLWDEDVQHCVGCFEPSFNRLAGFATSGKSWHGVTPVHCPPGMTRKSFAVYYYSKEAPPGWDGVKRSTVFRARPDEFWRGHLAMPAEELLKAGRETFASIKTRVKRLITPSS